VEDLNKEEEEERHIRLGQIGSEHQSASGKSREQKDTRTIFSSGKVINRHQEIKGARGEQGQFFHLARTRKGQ